MRRPYVPSDTDRALYRPVEILKCRCGVTFQARPEVDGEDPGKCLSCNRSPWSVLFEHAAPKPTAAVRPIRRKLA
jgi:hypothetical protein